MSEQDRKGAVMEFTTEKTRAEAAVDRVEMPFKLDGADLMAYLPTQSQAAMFYRIASRTATIADQLNGMLGFLEQVLDRRSYAHLERRVLDPADPFDIDPGLLGVLHWITEEYKNHQEEEPRPTNPVAAVRQARVARATAARKPAAKKAAAKKR